MRRSLYAGAIISVLDQDNRGPDNRGSTIHLHRISGEKEEGKEMRKKKEKKCSSDLAGSSVLTT